MSAWVAIIIGVLASFAGQALYWGRFEGRVLTRLDSMDGDVADLRASRKDMWREINDHAQRISKVEATCEARRGNKINEM